MEIFIALIICAVFAISDQTDSVTEKRFALNVSASVECPKLH